MLSLLVALAAPAPDTDVRAFMLCARQAAVRLEPSEDAPEDVAAAAVFSCQQLEAKLLSDNPERAGDYRRTALFYARAQAVAARLCRKTKDCSVASLPE